jgi:[ribosomal protein S5]-alanine N-acetyltransferase
MRLDVDTFGKMDWRALMDEDGKRTERAAPALETARLWLRAVDGSDVAELVDYYVRNKTRFASSSPARDAAFFTVRFWEDRIAQMASDFRDDKSAHVFLFLKPDARRVVGGIHLTEIIRGPLQSCFVGYTLDEAMEGRGLMTEAIRASIEYAFGELNLHRLQAGYVPTNARSGAVLRRAGFVVEGYSRDYVRINGEWEDHLFASLLNGNWRPADSDDRPRE